jgi:hypothetical protein
MKVLLVILRVVVLLAALGGAVGSVVIGLFMRSGAAEARLEADRKRAAGPSADFALAEIGFTPATVEELERRQDLLLRTFPFMLAAGLLGLVGGILAAVGRTGCGAIWLLVAAAGPAVLHPGSLCGTFPLILAGFLSLFAWLIGLSVKEPEAIPA